jgi:multiple sugar transport system permease protein
VIVANVWRGTAFSMLLLYAGLMAVNRELYEAARVDGAGRMRLLWHITLPQIRPILLVNAILITISTLNTFDMILSLTGGGPAQATEVLALHTYNSVFVNFNLAAGSVFAVILLVLSLLLTVGYRRLLRADQL